MKEWTQCQSDLALLAHHYRSDWSWTPQGLDGAQARLESVARRDQSAQRASRRERARPGSGSDVL